MADDSARALLFGLWTAGLAAVDPLTSLPPALPLAPAQGRSVLLSLGKAAAAMAIAALTTRTFVTGLVVVPHGTTRPDALPAHIQFLNAAHPVPDASSIAAAQAAISLVRSLTPADQLVALISGGGSAMLAAPVPGLSFADKQAMTRRLLASGAPIADINAVRAACSLVKGGGLWAACGTDDVVLRIMSDVPGDDGRLVASGPFSPDAFDPATAQAAAAQHGLSLPATSPLPTRPGQPEAQVFASARHCLAAAADHARAQGYGTTVLGDNLQGDAATLGHQHAALLLANGAAAPHIWLSGGETSVVVTDPTARGGRNLTYALAAAIALDGHPGVALLAADSDGIDGNSNAAGAFIDGGTAARIRAAGLDPAAMLAAHQSSAALAAADALLITGPTGVNVNDFRAMLSYR